MAGCTDCGASHYCPACQRLPGHAAGLLQPALLIGQRSREAYPCSQLKVIISTLTAVDSPAVARPAAAQTWHGHHEQEKNLSPPLPAGTFHLSARMHQLLRALRQICSVMTEHERSRMTGSSEYLATACFVQQLSEISNFASLSKCAVQTWRSFQFLCQHKILLMPGFSRVPGIAGGFPDGTAPKLMLLLFSIASSQGHTQCIAYLDSQQGMAWSQSHKQLHGHREIRNDKASIT